MSTSTLLTPPLRRRWLCAGLCLLACALPVLAQESPATAVHRPVFQKIDQKTGSGREALGGSTLTVHYSGWLYDPNARDFHGKQFDSSVGDAPFTFLLGARKVIKGWEDGLIGMKEGGKRTLIIPAEMGYGNRGAGAVIPPNANLIFDIELLEVR